MDTHLKICIPTLLLVSLLVSISGDLGGEYSANIGVSYGTLGNNLPSPSKSIDLIKSINGSQVKIYSADPEILKALKGTHIHVSVMVPNNLIVNMSSNQSMADDWVRTFILPFYRNTRIRYLLVGNEILSDRTNKPIWFALVPAMKRIRFALTTFHVPNIKVSTPMAIDVLDSVYPPSNGTFRSDIALSVVKPMLHFLHTTKSFLFVDLYTYFEYTKNYPKISLDYALLNGGAKFTDPGSGLKYTNLLDEMLDAFVFAMKKLGVPDIRLFIAETGWPNGCDIDEIGGNVHNAATYNRNLVKKLTTNPPIGTPARPGVAFPALIFALFNENQKGGPGTERHWGIFYPNGAKVYPIDLSGKTKTPSTENPPIPKGSNNVPYKGKIWCVLARGANVSELASAVSDACSQGNGTCDAIQPGKECYRPNQLAFHASYAFSSYWAVFRSQGAKCFFNGLAVQTIKDPSHGSCKYPNVNLS